MQILPKKSPGGLFIKAYLCEYDTNTSYTSSRALAAVDVPLSSAVGRSVGVEVMERLGGSSNGCMDTTMSHAAPMVPGSIDLMEDGTAFRARGYRVILRVYHLNPVAISSISSNTCTK